MVDFQDIGACGSYRCRNLSKQPRLVRDGKAHRHDPPFADELAHDDRSKQARVDIAT